MLKATDSVDFGMITADPALRQRAEWLAAQFNFSYLLWDKLDDYVDKPAECRVMVACHDGEKGSISPGEYAATARHFSPKAFIVVSIHNKLSADDVNHLRKQGADLVLSERDIFETSKMEFVLCDQVRQEYLPVKVADLYQGLPLGYDLYHYVPHRDKFLKFAFEGDVLSDEKRERLQQVKEIYIHRTAIEKFVQEMRELMVTVMLTPAQKARAQVLLLNEKFSELIMMLIDESSQASFTLGNRLLEDLRKISKDLVEAVAIAPDITEVVDQGGGIATGAIERAAATASYAGMFAMKMGHAQPELLVLTALIGDLGQVVLTPQISQVLREHADDPTPHKFMDEQQAQLYRAYPNYSIKLLLDRRIQVKEDVREIVLAKNEWGDGSGFPQGLHLKSIPAESQILALAQVLDRATIGVLAKSELPFPEKVKEVINIELQRGNRFGPDLLVKLMR